MASGQRICRVLKLDAAEAMHASEVAEPLSVTKVIAKSNNVFFNCCASLQPVVIGICSVLFCMQAML